ncbi:MAG: fatty acid oxidation complex subunit alpha FadB [Emcibacter sp.]|nr:fatty acid oxidation complex subunit alpha FadB [Emcibacter sp.]
MDDGIAELCFDLQGSSVNKLNALTLKELKEAAAAIAADAHISGVIYTSRKPAFIVGADITEFGQSLSATEEEIAVTILDINMTVFNAFEDLAIPTVAAINGIALGGGLEMALTADYRVMAADAKIGFPETKLGIIPGYGGTTRLPRLIGLDNAIEWIASGAEYKAKAALAVAIVDAVVAPELLKEAALDLVRQCRAGKLDYKARRQEKMDPLKLNDTEAMMAIETAKAFVASKAGPHYPAPITAIKVMQAAAKMGRDDALKEEAIGVARMAKSPVAKNLIGLFLGDQLLSKTAKAWADKVKTAKDGGDIIALGAVLGAGIMGGGIAYQSALKGTSIVMKDIAQAGIDLGLSEASKLLSKQVERGRMAPDKMAAILNKIQPTLSYEGFKNIDIVIEAVVENPKVKAAVLSEVEGKIREETILTSNTSTISIDYLAESLKRPENFCGMHFFNPVHKMPLVEIIRGKKTSEQAVAKTVAYALAMGKKPVVVNDCPGFLVNRMLAPYMGSFMDLVKRGADFTKIDRAMEKFGWPMGPAYLFDVVGIDTGVHSGDVMSDGFPDRMSRDYKSSAEILFEANRYGQKNGKGYYAYETDKKGRLKKVIDPDVADLLAPHMGAAVDFSDQEIIDLLMIPLCLEAVRCLEDGIAASATDVDMSLIYGIGFPPFRGGALHYIQDVGLATFVAKADKYAELGAFYHPTDKLREMATKGDVFFTF